jgi:hypothetical protein
MPRFTSDPKEMTLKLRLNDDMRNHVENQARIANVSMSEYLRNLILKDMKKL